MQAREFLHCHRLADAGIAHDYPDLSIQMTEPCNLEDLPAGCRVHKVQGGTCAICPLS
jgi:hypothetical protein